MMRAAMMAALLAGVAVSAAAKTPARDAKVWAAAERLRPAQLQTLEQVVNIDSGTGDVAGGDKVLSPADAAAEGLGGMSGASGRRPGPARQSGGDLSRSPVKAAS